MARLFGFIVVWVMLVMSAVAQTGGSGWPQRAIRLIVPFPAGSSTDIAARIVAQKLGLGLGQQVVIENRPGASGNIGAEVVAKAVPDGYTIGIATASTHAVAASLSTALPYDPVKDFAAIGMIGDQPYVLVVHPALAVHSLSDLIGLAKAKPRALNYGSAGVASLAHLATALFAKMAGMEIIHVPYKSSSQSMVDMITGRLDMQLATVALASQYPCPSVARSLPAEGARTGAAGRVNHRRVRPRGLRGSSVDSAGGACRDSTGDRCAPQFRAQWRSELAERKGSA